MDTLHEDKYTVDFLIISRSVLLRMKNASDRQCKRKSKHLLCSVIFFFRKSCSLWDNVEEYYRARQATD